MTLNKVLLFLIFPVGKQRRFHAILSMSAVLICGLAGIIAATQDRWGLFMADLIFVFLNFFNMRLQMRLCKKEMKMS